MQKVELFLPVPQDVYVRERKLSAEYYDCLVIPIPFCAQSLLIPSVLFLQSGKPQNIELSKDIDYIKKIFKIK